MNFGLLVWNSLTTRQLFGVEEPTHVHTLLVFAKFTKVNSYSRTWRVILNSFVFVIEISGDFERRGIIEIVLHVVGTFCDWQIWATTLSKKSLAEMNENGTTYFYAKALNILFTGYQCILLGHDTFVCVPKFWINCSYVHMYCHVLHKAIKRLQNLHTISWTDLALEKTYNTSSSTMLCKYKNLI
jgi:hypothetical protein